MSIVINNTNQGTTTDIDGKFNLSCSCTIDFLRLSYLGFVPVTFKPNGKTENIIIELNSANTLLEEVVVKPGENPANRIIKQVVKNRASNNPEKLNSFSYTTYSKMVFTAVSPNDPKKKDAIEDTITSSILPSALDTNKLAQPIQSNDFLKNALKDTVLTRQILKTLLTDKVIVSSLVKTVIKDSTIATFVSDALNKLLKDTTVFNLITQNSEIMNFLIKDSVINSYLKNEFTKSMQAVPDSNLQLIKNILSKQELFLMESVTKRKFLQPDRNDERVIATRVSGLQEPMFVLLATQMQSFSFYNDIVRIGENDYINPISKNSTSKYLFNIEDTLFIGLDTVYIISFRPAKNTNFDGLKGVLYINTNGYAVQNVISSPYIEKMMGGIKVQQKYEQINNHWFPVQLNTEITINISLNELKPFGIGKTYFKDIVINPDFKKNEFNATDLIVTDDAIGKSDNFWNQYRNDTLTAKEVNTYTVIDSISKKSNLEERARKLLILKTGYLPTKYINFPLDKIINYNDFEGLRLGIGAKTSRMFSKRSTVEAYGAYGLRDRQFKYAINGSFVLIKEPKIEINLGYLNDVSGSGQTEIYPEQKTFNDSYFRNFLIQRMVKIKRTNAAVSFTPIRYMKMDLAAEYGEINTASFFKNYSYPEPYTDFNYTEYSLGFRYAFKEKLIKNLDYTIAKKTKYPIVWFQATQGIINTTNTHNNYSRFDIKIEKSFYTKYIGETSFKIFAGYIDGYVPLAKLYNGKSSYRSLTIEAPNSFATMRMDEFISNKYASLFFTHNFGKLIIRKDLFHPEILITTNICYGTLTKQKELYPFLNTLEKGFYESGLLFRNIVNIGVVKFGVGMYYRYGQYAFSNPSDNIAYKLTIQTGF